MAKSARQHRKEHSFEEINTAIKAGDLTSALCEAARAGMAPLTKALLKRGADVHAQDKFGQTPLLSATFHGHAGIAKTLLNSGAVLTGQGRNYTTPLEGASYSGDLATVRMLHERGARLNQGYPLVLAAGEGHLEIVRFLLDKGANIEQTSPNGRTALMETAHNGHDDIVKELLKPQRGAKIEAADHLGRTALIYAAMSGKKKPIDTLLKHGANIHAKDERRQEHSLEGGGWTPLMWAVGGRYNDIQIVKTLLDKGAGTEDKDQEGCTALAINVVRDKTFKIAELLLKRGANIETKDNEGLTPLASVARYGWVKKMEPLVAKGANVNARDKEKRTPLMWAAMRREHDAAKGVETLLDLGAQINTRDKHGNTAVMLSVTQKERIEHVTGHNATFLLDRGATAEGLGTIPVDNHLMKYIEQHLGTKLPRYKKPPLREADILRELRAD
jgi:ankyrin repeat protein